MEASPYIARMYSCFVLTAAIAAVVCLLVAFITGTLCGALLTVCISRWNKKGHSSKPALNTQEQQQAAVVYEEVDTMQSKKIELKENVAYGPCSETGPGV